MSYRSTRLQSGSQARTSLRSSRTASKLSAFSNRCIGKKRPEKINLLKPVSLDRNSKTKRYLQALDRTKSVSTTLKVIRLRNAIFSINGFDRKVGRFKGSTLRVSSKLSKLMRPSRSGTVQLTRS